MGEGVVKYLVALLSILTILALDLILVLGAAVHDPESIRPYFGALVTRDGAAPPNASTAIATTTTGSRTCSSPPPSAATDRLTPKISDGQAFSSPSAAGATHPKAGPFGPPATQPVSGRSPGMCSSSASADQTPRAQG